MAPANVSGSSCGTSIDCRGESCCTSLRVPGGTYNRGADSKYPATVSDFYLDKYEVTVKRFRKFVEGYDAWRASGHPAQGDGAWLDTWNDDLTTDSAALRSWLGICDFPTWSDTPGTTVEESRPINCVSWYQALAFCIWDGGRLPTEAEWEYAAGNGDQNWTYPWGDTPEPDDTRAVIDCRWDGDPNSCAMADIAPVGSVPAGDGRWGQSDLAGSMWEWVQDASLNAYSISPCIDCVEEDGLYPSQRSTRGGGWYWTRSILEASYRGGEGPELDNFDLGFRCARSLP